MVNISLSDPFVAALSVIVLAGMMAFLPEFLFPDRYMATKKTINFASKFCGPVPCISAPSTFTRR
jgi:hypothetical protein